MNTGGHWSDSGHLPNTIVVSLSTLHMPAVCHLTSLTFCVQFWSWGGGRLSWSMTWGINLPSAWGLRCWRTSLAQKVSMCTCIRMCMHMSICGPKHVYVHWASLGLHDQERLRLILFLFASVVSADLPTLEEQREVCTCTYRWCAYLSLSFCFYKHVYLFLWIFASRLCKCERDRIAKLQSLDFS